VIVSASISAATMVMSVTLMGGLWPFGGSDKPNPGDTISDLSQRQYELKRDPIVEDGALFAREQYRIFLELSVDNPELQMEAMRRLGDLNLSAAEKAQFDGVDGGVDQGFYAEAASLYLALLNSNPDYVAADRILYQLSRTYEAMGDSEQALETLDRLVSDYPGSDFFDEAQFRRGEILFVEKRFPSAEVAYAEVIARGSNSPFYEQALYKHGWSLFKQSHHEESLGSFMDLLDIQLAREGEITGAERLTQMSRPQRELVDDTFRVLSITFSYLDAAVSINALMSVRGEPYYSDLLYEGLGSLYLDKERYTDAAETYADFVSHHPTHPHSPQLQVRVVEAYTLGKFPSLVLDAKRDYVDLYGLDSAFWVGREPVNWPGVVAHLKENLTDLAAYDHALAQEDGDVAAYGRAAALYRQYLGYFPEDPDSAKRNFLLAEILFEVGRFDEATAEYLHTAYDYGPHDQASEAGYAALVSAEKFTEGLAGDEREAWRSASMASALRFAESFPAHAQAAPVLTTVAEELFEDGRREEAMRVAGLVITLQPPAAIELERTAWTVIAHSQFDLQHYAQAEQAYQRLSEMPIEDDQTRREINERIAASVYRQGEQAQADGDTAGAVAQFMRVADVQPGSEFVPAAMFDAAALLVTTQQWQEAAGVLEQFRGQFPDHKFNDDVTQKLAVAYQASGQHARAGAEYERIAGTPTADAALHREALWRAGELYAESDDVGGQQRVYTEIVRRFPDPLSESIEARQLLADLAAQAGAVSVRNGWLESIIEADKTAGSQGTERSQTLAAQASLELASPVRDAFMAVKLTNPLQASLKLKKERMELALEAYGAAAEYGVSEVTTAATYEIADLYYWLSKDLMSSERPGTLSEEELEQYDILLEEQAFPFEEKAIDIFGANADRAVDGIYDQWVRKSFARLAELMPARFAKTERSESLVAVLD
jgi:TolA-binding protein